MKNSKNFKKAFGLNEFGIVDFPSKMSNVQLSRLVNGVCSGCTWCFPHGYETINSTIGNRQKNWKKFRTNKWKPIICKLK